VNSSSAAAGIWLTIRGVEHRAQSWIAELLAICAVSAWSVACVSGAGVANASAGRAARGVFVVAGHPLEFDFLLSTRRIARGHVRFHVRNVGGLPHRFKVCSFPTGRTSANDCVGRQTRVIAPGRAATLAVLFSRKGRYEFVCGVRGHAAAGMKGIIVVR
jgi:uncharacterized cupredoxin-like copper-binding protein